MIAAVVREGWRGKGINTGLERIYPISCAVSSTFNAARAIGLRLLAARPGGWRGWRHREARPPWRSAHHFGQGNQIAPGPGEIATADPQHEVAQEGRRQAGMKLELVVQDGKGAEGDYFAGRLGAGTNGI